MSETDGEKRERSGSRLTQPLRANSAVDRVERRLSADAYSSELAFKSAISHYLEQKDQEYEWQSALCEDLGEKHSFTKDPRVLFAVSRAMTLYAKWRKRPKTRKGHLRRARSALWSTALIVLEATEEVVRLRDNLPASINPITPELEEAHGAVRLALLGFVHMADALQEELDVYDPKRDSGPKTSTDRLFDDPLKQLIQVLGKIWCDDGNGFEGSQQFAFLDAVDLVHQLAVGKPMPDHPEIISWASEVREIQ